MSECSSLQQMGAGCMQERARPESEEEIDEDIQGKTADSKSNCSRGAWWKAAKDL